MIVANMATYPPRRESMIRAARAIAPQVDRLTIVLNQYEAVPAELSELSNIVPVLPEQDRKDLAKFAPATEGAETVVLVDDDLVYPADYVAETQTRIAALPDRDVIAGYHGTIYLKPGPSLDPKWLLRWLRWKPGHAGRYKAMHNYWEAMARPRIVTQVGTGTAFLPGHLMPTFDDMAGSEFRVDIRLARLAQERGIPVVCLPRAAGWLGQVDFDETIYDSFTRTLPPDVAEEILQFAFDTKQAGDWL